MVSQAGYFPACSVDRRQHLNVHRRGTEDEISLGCDITGIADDDGNNRYSGLHGEMERAFFEGRQSGRYCAGALGCKHHRLAFIFHGFNKGQHRIDGTPGIGPVDKDGAAVLQHFAQYGCFCLDLLFANARDITAQQFGDNHHVGFALVIENKNRRTM